MDIMTATSFLAGLQDTEERVMYTSIAGVKVTVIHTGKLSPRDFAAGLVIPGRTEFRPTHVRLLFDYYLKRLSNIKLSQRLFDAAESVYKGEDPEGFTQVLGNVQFPMQLDEPMVNLVYTQLLMIEQDLNYGPGGAKKSSFDPARGFLMAFIRWVASGEDEIDKIITSAVRNYPPPGRFKDRAKA